MRGNRISGMPKIFDFRAFRTKVRGFSLKCEAFLTLRKPVGFQRNPIEIPCEIFNKNLLFSRGQTSLLQPFLILSPPLGSHAPSEGHRNIFKSASYP